ncbi:BLUF domain-containing protein [Ramlibacter sp. AN1015]|uniref:BLUF domain-containing protein n=1 Tax=Ramlibacter sp. AN1015 TaxID=3133428 RepID=UPI0030C41133
MICLTYTSTCAGVPLSSELKHLLSRAQARNAEFGVTGLLLFRGGAFAQCIEGPAESIEHILGVISADPLHTDIVITSRERVTERAFPEWSMALRTVHGSFMSFGGPRLSKRLSPEDAQASLAMRRMLDFWSQGDRTT